MAVKELEIKPFSKKGYKSFKFEDIAFCISERVEPKQTNLDIYIGLEHLDPNSIHIKRHGTPADVEGTKLKVYPGDLIFGKRRAYQRKAAIATFEGICSAHAMVLRANPKVINPELFPFFIHSDQFMNRAIDISVGSLSPTINWGTLKTQEFVLPPLDQQAKLAELLWAGDNLHNKNIELKVKLEQISSSIFKEFITTNSNIKHKPLGELLLQKPAYGANASAVNHVEGTPRYLRITDIKDNGDLNNEIVGCDLVDCSKYLLKENDVLIARTAVPGRSFIYKNKFGPCAHAGYLLKFSVNDNLLLPDYFFLYTKTLQFDEWIRKTTKKGTVTNINSQEYCDFQIPLPSINIQREIIEKINNSKSVLEKVISNNESSANIQQQLINQIFS